MTRTSVADAMPTATRLREYLLLFLTWLSNKLHYEFVMSINLMFLNVTAIVYLYMKDGKIPFPEDNIYLQSCVLFLVLFTMLSCVAWSYGIFKVEAYDMYIFGTHLSHLRLRYFPPPPLCYFSTFGSIVRCVLFGSYPRSWKAVNEPQFRVVIV